MEVLEISHRGVPCLVPATQVLAVDARPDGPELVLWAGRPHATESERFVLLHTRHGPRHLRGVEIRLRQFSASEAYPLPALLRDALRLPHVVGISERGGLIRWLVDLEQVPAGTEG